jgi:hypothetical protein
VLAAMAQPSTVVATPRPAALVPEDQALSAVSGLNS